ncbi:unnamed protein product [Ixodes persulcatus]
MAWTPAAAAIGSASLVPSSRTSGIGDAASNVFSHAAFTGTASENFGGMIGNTEGFISSTFNNLSGSHGAMAMDMKSTFPYASQFATGANTSQMCKDFEMPVTALASLRQKSREHAVALGFF